MNRAATPSRPRCSAVLLALGLLAASAVHGAQGLADLPGYVDSKNFVDLAGGPEAVRIEVSIHPSLMKLMCQGLEAELKAAACGLEFIGAVIVDLSPDRSTDAEQLLSRTEASLRGAGWERLAFVKQEREQVRVLLLNDEESIRGLVVMVMDLDEGQLVFANVAGLIDLQALQRLGRRLNVPGMEHLEEAGR